MTQILDRPPVIETPKIAGINLDSLMHKFAVEAFNNDISTFEDVMNVFKKACGYDNNTSKMYTSRIHRTGKAVCFWNSKEKCEFVIDAFTHIGVKALLREG